MEAEPDLTAELDAAEEIVMGRAAVDNRRWPCPEVADITAALAGKGTGDGD